MKRRHSTGPSRLVRLRVDMVLHLDREIAGFGEGWPMTGVCVAVLKCLEGHFDRRAIDLRIVDGSDETVEYTLVAGPKPRAKRKAAKR